MQPAGTNLGRFPSKFLLTVIPGVVASGIVALVLYAVHVSGPPSSSEVLTDLTPQGDGLSTEERRGLTRQMLRARRENQEEPEQVRPTPTSRPATIGLAQDPPVDVKAATTPPAVDVKTSVDRTPAAAPLPAARPANVRVRPDSPAVVTSAAPAASPVVITPPAVASAQSAPVPPATSDPASPPPVAVNTPPDGDAEPQPRGFAANVFSSLSTFAGTAANATGNTVNWVIDLPGKAISAGGRLFGGDSTANNNAPAASPPPAGAPPPSTGPPPKRNL